MNRPFEYRQALDQLSFSPEQKQAIADRAVQAAQSAQSAPPVRRRPLWRTAVIAAALAAMLAVSAGASGILKTAAESFAGIFGAGAAQTEVIDMIGRPIGASDTDNGVTITADAILGDRYNAAIIFTIRRDDGTPLLPEGTKAEDLLLGGTGGADLNVRGGVHGSAWFVTDEADPSAIQMVQTFSSDVPLTNCTADADFQSLCRWDEAAGQAVPILEGSWNFRFDVDYEDASLTFGGGETFTQGGMTFTVDQVSVSPIAVQVSYRADREVQWSDQTSGRLPEEDSMQLRKYLENIEILLTKTDGTVIDLSSSGGSVGAEDGYTACTKGGVLEEILPLEELASISVGGVVYPVHAG